MDLTSANIEVHGIIGNHVAEPFGNSNEFDTGRQRYGRGGGQAAAILP